MTEEKQSNNQINHKDFVTHIINTENRYYQEVTIAKITGECPYGHKEGEKYKVTNCNNDNLCGALYKAIHASIVTLHYGGGLPWEKSPDTFKGICPEMRVQIEVRRFEKEDFNLLKTQTHTRDMTGKGFPALDKYRAFIEIIDIANNCAWGHKEGQRFEVDPFNVGGVCGFLYSHVYQFMNLYFAGAGLPWEREEHIMHTSCPDTFNQTSFRLVMEER
jgi:uncharacterized repeat protein (TIGR04076 family)